MNVAKDKPDIKQYTLNSATKPINEPSNKMRTAVRKGINKLNVVSAFNTAVNIKDYI